MNATIPPDSHRPAPPPNETRLESWGEIASYLRRDVRTVQRWERTLELPVRRLHVGKISSVYAYRSELDKWYLERQPPDEHTEKPKNPDPLTNQAETDSRKDFGKGKKFAQFWQLAMMAAVVLASAAGIHYYTTIIGHF